MKQQHAHILIIEDDHFQQELLKIWLEAEDYQITIAKHGEQALNIVQQSKPDLILLDLVMPVIDGFKVASLLKESPDTKAIPIIVVTVLDAHDKKIRALEAGVDDFVNKPVDRIELLVRIKNLLKSRDYFKQLQARQAHLLQLENLSSIGTLIRSVTNQIALPLQQLDALIDGAQSSDNTELAQFIAQIKPAIERIALITHNTQLYIKSIGISDTESAQVSRVLSDVLELLKDKITGAGIKIETNIAGNLPLVRCSTEGLMHVLVHVLLNAYETLENYPNGVIKINVALTEDNLLVIAICDNNAQSAGNFYSLITDPLFSTALPTACTGLSLALACHFVENSGGTISVDSTAGQGCCMKITLKTL